MKIPVIISLFALVQPCAADECSKTSPPYKTTLVELFTSDGCDSCPPANKWLSQLVKEENPGVIPLSMHVTYWNHLGWVDRFSDRIFDQRQAEYSRTAVSKFSYTPEVFAGGKEWRNWRMQQALSDVVNKNSKSTAPLNIEIKAERLAGHDELNVTVTLAQIGTLTSSGQLYVALYEDDLSTDINAGENKGSVLRHDHVVRQWIGPIPFSGVRSQHRQTLSLEKQWNTKQMGVVALVQSSVGGEVLQAVDLPLCGK